MKILKNYLFRSILLLVTLNSFAGGPPSDGLVFSQPFNNNSFTDGLYRNSITTTGVLEIITTTGTSTTTSNPILINNVLSFNGQGFAVASLSGTSLTSTAFGISMDVVFTTVDGINSIFSLKPNENNTMISLEYSSSGYLNIYVYENYPTSSDYEVNRAFVPNLDISTMSGKKNIAVTWELGKPLLVFLDGKVIISFLPKYTPTATPTLAYFGGSAGFPTFSFKGSMDNISFYDRLLNFNDLNDIYYNYNYPQNFKLCTTAPVMPYGVNIGYFEPCSTTNSIIIDRSPNSTTTSNFANGYYLTKNNTTIVGSIEAYVSPEINNVLLKSPLYDFGTYTGYAFNSCGISEPVTIIKEAKTPQVISFSAYSSTSNDFIYINPTNYAGIVNPSSLKYFSNKKTIGNAFQETKGIYQYYNVEKETYHPNLNIKQPDADDYSAVYKSVIYTCGNTIAGPYFTISLNTLTGNVDVTTVPASAFVTSIVNNETIESTIFSIYPNPNSGSFVITLASIGINNFVISAIDGTVLAQGNLIEGKNTIDVALSKGIYFVQVGNNVKKLALE